MSDLFHTVLQPNKKEEDSATLCSKDPRCLTSAIARDGLEQRGIHSRRCSGCNARDVDEAAVSLNPGFPTAKGNLKIGATSVPWVWSATGGCAGAF